MNSNSQESSSQHSYYTIQSNSNQYSNIYQEKIPLKIQKIKKQKKDEEIEQNYYKYLSITRQDKYKPLLSIKLPYFSNQQLYSMDKVLIFVRHAERVPLTYGDQLTQTGIQKAREFGKFLKNKFPLLIYANPIFRSTHKKRTSRTNYLIQLELYKDLIGKEIQLFPIISKNYSKSKEIKDFILKQVKIILTDKQIEDLIKVGNLSSIKDIPDFLDEIDTQVKQQKFTSLPQNLETFCQIKFDQLMNVVYSNRKVSLLLISKFYKDILNFMHDDLSRFMLFSCHDTTLLAISKLIFKKGTYRIGQCDYLDYIIIKQHGDTLTCECLVSGNTHQELYFNTVGELEEMFEKYIQYEGSQESFILDVDDMD